MLKSIVWVHRVLRSLEWSTLFLSTNWIRQKRFAADLLPEQTVNWKCFFLAKQIWKPFHTFTLSSWSFWLTGKLWSQFVARAAHTERHPLFSLRVSPAPVFSNGSAQKVLRSVRNCLPVQLDQTAFDSWSDQSPQSIAAQWQLIQLDRCLICHCLDCCLVFKKYETTCLTTFHQRVHSFPMHRLQTLQRKVRSVGTG